MLEVVMEADVSCPRCSKLEPLLRRITSELDIPFYVKYLGNKSVAAYEESIISKTFSREWIEKWGLSEHKEKLEKIAPILDYLQEAGVQMTPVVVVRWHDGYRMREIVVRGFNPEGEQARQYLFNLYTLLKVLKKVVYGK